MNSNAGRFAEFLTLIKNAGNAFERTHVARKSWMNERNCQMILYPKKS